MSAAWTTSAAWFCTECHREFQVSINTWFKWRRPPVKFCPFCAFALVDGKTNPLEDSRTDASND